MSRYVIRGPLTYELVQRDSPIRQFFDGRLGAGLNDAQAAYRRRPARFWFQACPEKLPTQARSGPPPTG